MGKILKQIERQIGIALKAVGIPKKKFDIIIGTSGWIILAYVVLTNINKKTKGDDND